MGARYYWPEIGRFIQQDHIGDGINWYAYVDGNPVTRIDPAGLDWLDDVSNASAGFGDWISLGYTNWWRQQVGVNDVVDPCSSAYRAGRWGGVAYDVAWLAVGVGEAKAAVGAAKAKAAAKGRSGLAATVRELTKGKIGLDLDRASGRVSARRLMRAGVPEAVARANPKVPHLNIGRYHVIVNRYNWCKPWKWFVR